MLTVAKSKSMVSPARGRLRGLGETRMDRAKASARTCAKQKMTVAITYMFVHFDVTHTSSSWSP